MYNYIYSTHSILLEKCSLHRWCLWLPLKNPSINTMISLGKLIRWQAFNIVQIMLVYNLVHSYWCTVLCRHSPSYFTPRHLVPDSMVVSLLCRRLNRLDCMTRGYVLHGFPLSKDQAQLLAQNGHQPNRYIYIATYIQGKKVLKKKNYNYLL